MYIYSQKKMIGDSRANRAKGEKKSMVRTRHKGLLPLILIWLCGMWSFGLGLRLSVELLLSNGWISIPKYAGYGVNLWFDFIPLCGFGLFVTVWSIKTLFKKLKKPDNRYFTLDEIIYFDSPTVTTGVGGEIKENV